MESLNPDDGVCELPKRIAMYEALTRKNKFFDPAQSGLVRFHLEMSSRPEKLNHSTRIYPNSRVRWCRTEFAKSKITRQCNLHIGIVLFIIVSFTTSLCCGSPTAGELAIPDISTTPVSEFGNISSIESPNPESVSESSVRGRDNSTEQDERLRRMFSWITSNGINVHMLTSDPQNGSSNSERAVHMLTSDPQNGSSNSERAVHMLTSDPQNGSSNSERAVHMLTSDPQNGSSNSERAVHMLTSDPQNGSSNSERAVHAAVPEKEDVKIATLSSSLDAIYRSVGIPQEKDHSQTILPFQSVSPTVDRSVTDTSSTSKTPDNISVLNPVATDGTMNRSETIVDKLPGKAVFGEVAVSSTEDLDNLTNNLTSYLDSDRSLALDGFLELGSSRETTPSQTLKKTKDISSEISLPTLHRPNDDEMNTFNSSDDGDIDGVLNVVKPETKSYVDILDSGTESFITDSIFVDDHYSSTSPSVDIHGPGLLDELEQQRFIGQSKPNQVNVLGNRLSAASPMHLDENNLHNGNGWINPAFNNNSRIVEDVVRDNASDSIDNKTASVNDGHSSDQDDGDDVNEDTNNKKTSEDTNNGSNSGIISSNINISKKRTMLEQTSSSSRPREGITCYCNLGSCAARGYTCRSTTGACYVRRSYGHQDGYPEAGYRLRHVYGCLEMLEPSDQKRCRAQALGVPLGVEAVQGPVQTRDINGVVKNPRIPRTLQRDVDKRKKSSDKPDDEAPVKASQRKTVQNPNKGEEPTTKSDAERRSTRRKKKSKQRLDSSAEGSGKLMQDTNDSLSGRKTKDQARNGRDSDPDHKPGKFQTLPAGTKTQTTGSRAAAEESSAQMITRNRENFQHIDDLVPQRKGVTLKQDDVKQALDEAGRKDAGAEDVLLQCCGQDVCNYERPNTVYLHTHLDTKGLRDQQYRSLYSSSGGGRSSVGHHSPPQQATDTHGPTLLAVAALLVPAVGAALLLLLAFLAAKLLTTDGSRSCHGPRYRYEKAPIRSTDDSDNVTATSGAASRRVAREDRIRRPRQDTVKVAMDDTDLMSREKKYQDLALVKYHFLPTNTGGDSFLERNQLETFSFEAGNRIASKESTFTSFSLLRKKKDRRTQACQASFLRESSEEAPPPYTILRHHNKASQTSPSLAALNTTIKISNVDIGYDTINDEAERPMEYPRLQSRENQSSTSFSHQKPCGSIALPLHTQRPHPLQQQCNNGHRPDESSPDSILSSDSSFTETSKESNPEVDHFTPSFHHYLKALDEHHHLHHHHHIHHTIRAYQKDVLQNTSHGEGESKTPAVMAGSRELYEEYCKALAKTSGLSRQKSFSSFKSSSNPTCSSITSPTTHTSASHHSLSGEVLPIAHAPTVPSPTSLYHQQEKLGLSSNDRQPSGDTSPQSSEALEETSSSPSHPSSDSAQSTQQGVLLNPPVETISAFVPETLSVSSNLPSDREVHAGHTTEVST